MEKGRRSRDAETLNPQPSTFGAYWNQYVPQHLLPRLHAFELMMAPYAIAHMKIGLKLAETGYRFGTEERARIYLTNALEPKVQQLPQIGFDALAHEAAAVNEIKWYKRFTVVIGNPPYSNFGQLNKNPFISGLLEDYKRGLGEMKINLDDDFIKFVRFSQHLLDVNGSGVFGMITNNVFIDGITHRQMRESLKASFADVRILDLHGSSKKLEETPDGKKDENVFDIQQGVGIPLSGYALYSSDRDRQWLGLMAEDYPRTLTDLEPRFSTDAACEQYLAGLRWPDGFRCPGCAGTQAWRTARGRWLCRACARHTSVTAGTIFADSNLPLRLWVRAIWQVVTQKDGASAMGLPRVLGLGSYRTAWSLRHKLRRAMVRPGRERLRGIVEVDERATSALRSPAKADASRAAKP